MPQRDTLYYDGQCGLCRRSVRVFRALDWLGRLDDADFTQLSDDELLKQCDFARGRVEPPERAHTASSSTNDGPCNVLGARVPVAAAFVLRAAHDGRRRARLRHLHARRK